MTSGSAGGPGDPGGRGDPGWLWRRFRDRAAGLFRTLGAVLRPGRAERELDEEHAFHIQMETEKRIREGLDPAEARRQARVAFGGVERWQEEVRGARWTSSLERLWLDFRYAVRTLAGAPLLVAVVVVTLGVAIGASTTVFGLVDAVLLRPLDVPAADRLVGVAIQQGDRGLASTVSYPDYVDLRQGSGSVLAGLAAHSLADIAISDGERADAALGVFASATYFGVLGVTPALGRFFGAGEAAPGSTAAVAVLSHDAWRSRFGGDRDIVGREIHVNGEPLTVIGVAPEGFHGAFLGTRPVAWMPLGLAARLQSGSDIGSRTTWRWLQLIGRLAPAVTAERAERALSTVSAGMAATYDYPDHIVPGAVDLVPYRGLPPTTQTGGSLVLSLLLGAALLLLLVAAVNVAGMQLARASARSREMGVRMALGAGRARLIRQLGVEGALLGLAGAGAGAGIAAWAGALIGRIQPPGAEGFALEIGLNGWVVAFAMGAGLLTSLVFGLLPALRATGGDVRTAVSDGGSAPSSARLRSTLVGGQVALTLVLLVGTALLVRSLRSAAAVDHGFDPEGVVVAEVNLRLNDYDEPRGRAFYDALLEQLRAAPEVASAALATSVPLGQSHDRTFARVPGFETPDPRGIPVTYAAVSADYFRTLGMTLRAGALRAPPDGGPDASAGAAGDAGTESGAGGPRAGAAGPIPVVVNTAFADRFWGSGQAVGQPFTFFGEDAVVTGVAPTGRYRSFSESPRAFAVVPFGRRYSSSALVLIRPAGPQSAAVGAFRRSLARLDPYVPAINITTLDRAMGQSLFIQEFAVTLVGVFAAVGLILSATGIFGLLAYAVAQRRREIGIRMAVGSPAGRIARSVIRSGLRPVVIGTLAGLAGALVVTGVLESALVGITARDPVSFAAAALLVLAVATLAAWFPARRATRVDPASVLRVE